MNKSGANDFVKKHIFKFIIVVLCVFFVGGVGIGARNIMRMESNYSAYEHIEAASPRPVEPTEIVAFLDRAIDKAIAEKPAMTSAESCGIDEDSLTAEPSSPVLTASAKYIRDALDKHIEDSFEKAQTDYGEGFEQIIKSLDIADADILSAECKDEYYRCQVCGETFDESTEGFDPATDTHSCPKCEVKEELELRHRDEYTIKIVLKDNSPSVARNYTFRTPKQAASLADESCNGFFTCALPKIEYSNPVITAKVNRNTEKIVSLELRKDALVKTALTFEGDYAFFGTVDSSFKISDGITYNFSWPGLSLSSKKMSLEHGKTEVLKATLTCSDPVKQTVRWSSSDESIATVDEDGYIYTKKLDGYTTITAEFDFQGQTYKDSCEIFVRVPAESINISTRTLTLKAGDTASITAEVSPHKATLKTFKWYSSDETVVTVTPDGTVTAVGEGAVKVFAVADDGNYKATCKVEVTK